MRRLLLFVVIANVIGVGSVSAKKIEKKDENLTQKNIQKAMEQEKKFAKEQRFYHGKEYDLKSKEVDEKTIQSVPSIEPDYDFDITDVYRDDI